LLETPKKVSSDEESSKASSFDEESLNKDHVVAALAIEDSREDNQSSIRELMSTSEETPTKFTEETPDEDEKRENDQGKVVHSGEIHWRWQDALKTATFWATVLSASTTGILWSGEDRNHVTEI